MVTGHARSASAVGPGLALPIYKVFHKYNNLSTLTEGGTDTAASQDDPTAGASALGVNGTIADTVESCGRRSAPAPTGHPCGFRFRAASA